MSNVGHPNSFIFWLKGGGGYGCVICSQYCIISISYIVDVMSKHLSNSVNMPLIFKYALFTAIKAKVRDWKEKQNKISTGELTEEEVKGQESELLSPADVSSHCVGFRINTCRCKSSLCKL